MMKKIISLALISMMTLSACAGSNSEAEVNGTAETTNDGTGSKVYFTKEVTDTKHIKHDIVGTHLRNYDLMVNLAHKIMSI